MSRNSNAMRRSGTAKDAEWIWRARDAYRMKSLFVTLALLALVCMLTFFCGCEAYTRAVSPLSGYKGDPLPGPCAPASLQAGACVKTGATP